MLATNKDVILIQCNSTNLEIFMNPIIPTVGRIVYFMPGIGCNLAVSKAGVLAALITAVHTDDCINLAVFDADGEHHALSSVNHESIATQYVDGRHSCWDWMPKN